MTEGEFVLHRLRHFAADDAGAAEFGVHAARAVILDQQHELVAFLDDAVLHVAVAEAATAVPSGIEAHR